MKWRLIEQESRNASMNMAIDHAVYESVANGREKPTIRFYKWKNNSVSIGAYQNQNEIDLEACKKRGIDVVRRMTGVRAVFHDKADFTYSVISHIRVFKYSIQNAYNQICSCILNALDDLGMKGALENKNDIIVNGKKISGNAAKAMDKGVYLQHGTLIYDIDFRLMPKIMNITQAIARKKITSISQFKKLSQKQVYEALETNFVFGKDFTIEDLSEYEIKRAEDLARTRYNNIELPAGSFMKNKGSCYVERGG